MGNKFDGETMLRFERDARNPAFGPDQEMIFKTLAEALSFARQYMSSIPEDVYASEFAILPLFYNGQEHIGHYDWYMCPCTASPEIKEEVREASKRAFETLKNS